jgi:hypothetical protein
MGKDLIAPHRNCQIFSNWPTMIQILRSEKNAYISKVVDPPAQYTLTVFFSFLIDLPGEHIFF